MGGLCSHVRPRYKLHVRGVFDGKSDDLCTFAKLYPKQLPQLGRYLLKQLNIRVQAKSNRSTVLTKARIREINLLMDAWNDLIFTCNDDMEVMEKFILQSMTLLFADNEVQFHSFAMNTLRKYLPFSRKMSSEEFLLFLDSSVTMAESPETPIRIDALKTLSVIFTHLDSSFWPDLLDRYPSIVSVILRNLDPQTEGECPVYAEHSYEQFCNLISSQNLHAMFKPMSLVLTDQYDWKPTAFVIKLFDILVHRDIEPISIIQETLLFLHKLHSTDSSEETFAEFINRLTIMDSIIIVLQQFSSRVISKKTNRNPILSKLCALLDAVDVVSLKTDSMDINTERVLQFSRHLLDCVQYYSIDISYIDSQSVLLRMVRQCSTQKSPAHAQLQLQCVLRTIAHRTGKFRSSERTLDDIIRAMLQFQIQQHYRQDDTDDIVDLLHLSLQNMLLISAETKGQSEEDHDGVSHVIGFDEISYSINRVEEFLESQTKINKEAMKINAIATESSSPSRDSMDSTSELVHEWEGMSVCTVPIVPREWIYAAIYSYCSSSSDLKCDTLRRLTNSIIMVAISPHRFGSRSRKIYNEVVDFDILIPFLLSLQKLGEQFHQEFIKEHKVGNSGNAECVHISTESKSSTTGTKKKKTGEHAEQVPDSVEFIASTTTTAKKKKTTTKTKKKKVAPKATKSCRASVLCHSMVLSVMLYIRKFIQHHHGHKSNYKPLFNEFNRIIDGVYSKCKKDKQFRNRFRIKTNGLIGDDNKLGSGLFPESNTRTPVSAMTHTIPFDKVMQSLGSYFDLMTDRRSSITSLLDPWKERLCRDFPVAIILNALSAEDDDGMTPSESQSVIMSHRNLSQFARSTISFEDDLLQYQLGLKEGVHSTTTSFGSLQMQKPLERLDTFEEIISAYSENAQQVERRRHSMTDIPEEQHPPNYPHYEPNGETGEHSTRHSKRFTFSTELFEHLRPDQEFFEETPDLMKLRSSQRDSDFNQFYSENESRINPSHLLHEGLCNRLGLETLEIERVHDLPDVESELDRLGYNDIEYGMYRNSAMDTPIHHHHGYGIGIGIVDSPMRQLKTKVNKIKDRTRRFTKFGRGTVTVQNIKNTPSAIAEKGSKAIKDGWRTVMSKMKKPDTEESQDLGDSGNERDNLRMGSVPCALDVSSASNVKEGRQRQIKKKKKKKTVKKKVTKKVKKTKMVSSTRSDDRHKKGNRDRGRGDTFSKPLDSKHIDDESMSEETDASLSTEIMGNTIHIPVIAVERITMSHGSDPDSPMSQGSINTV